MVKRIGFYLLVFLLVVEPAFAVITYPTPGNTIPRPGLPELYANEGRTFQRNGITITTVPGTIPYDTYLTVQVVEKVYPIHIAKYWQVSDIYEIWFRSHFNQAKVENARKESIVVIPYIENDLHLTPFANLPEESLKMVCSPDGGDTWTMEKSSSVDISAHTVSALTEVGGGCMLMSGFVPVTQYNNYRAVKGAFVSNETEVKNLVRDELDEAPFLTRLSVIFKQIFSFFM